MPEQWLVYVRFISLCWFALDDGFWEILAGPAGRVGRRYPGLSGRDSRVLAVLLA